MPMNPDGSWEPGSVADRIAERGMLEGMQLSQAESVVRSHIDSLEVVGKLKLVEQPNDNTFVFRNATTGNRWLAQKTPVGPHLTQLSWTVRRY